MQEIYTIAMTKQARCLCGKAQGFAGNEKRQIALVKSLRQQCEILCQDGNYLAQ